MNEAVRRTSALLIVALVLSAQPCAGATSESLRGHHHRHHIAHRHHHSEVAVSHVQVRAPAAPKPQEVKKPAAVSTPKETEAEPKLYDEFLSMMNHAASKALQEQKAVPAYDDFLHLMKNGAEKAYKEQAGAPSYDDFLGVMKGKTAEAYQQQVEMPSYDDFLAALKESGEVALKKPNPKYSDFLTNLQDAAQMSMQKRVFSELGVETVEKLAAHYKKKEQSASKQNPLDALNPFKDAKKAERQMKGEKAKEDTGKLREELKRLRSEQKSHKADAGGGKMPDHVKRPLMKRINVLRTQLCWKRPNLWQHEKCMRFLGLHCMTESTGEGICKAFTKKAGEKCETSNDPKWKEDYCALSEALSETYGDEEEVGEENEHVEEAHDADDAEAITGDVGTDDDLDEDLEEMDEEMADKKAEDGEDATDGAAQGAAGKKGKKGGNKGEDGKDGTGDRDGDGVLDKDDAMPDDPNEWKDTDKDGIGDNADTDRDGDGKDNAVDAFPDDAKEWADTDRDGIGDNADKDSDNDGIPNDKDDFPMDPTEWKDSDKDGIGDNKDHYPYNPNCHSASEPCNDIKDHGMPKPGSSGDPTILDKDALRPLPSQGFSEAMSGPLVNHNNYYTWTSDWQDEWPMMAETEKTTMARICKEHPMNIWCRRFKNHDAHFR